MTPQGIKLNEYFLNVLPFAEDLESTEDDFEKQILYLNTVVTELEKDISEEKKAMAGWGERIG